MKRQRCSVRTLMVAVLAAGLLLAPFATAAPAAKPEKPPAGMGLYIVALHDPLPPAGPGKDGPPDISALGGRVLQRIMNRQLVHLPLGVSKKLRKNDAVAYVQRVWMGESASEWDEQDDPGNAGGRVAANTEEEGPSWFSGDYQYDGVGNITAVGNGPTYSYDSAGRLIKSMTAGRVETYGYDSFGNLTSRALEGVPTVTTSVDPATNRLTSRLHDTVGNVTSDRNGLAYEYDAIGMMTGMTATNGQRRRMLYTADDERIATSSSDLTRVRVRDFDGKVLRELTQYENQSWAEWGRDYIYGNGALVAGEREGSVANRERHYHLDHLGSVRLITTADGMRVSFHEYLPFGTELTDRTQEYQTFGPLYIKADPMKFTSHERDVTGLDNVDDSDYLDYMHARYYDGGVGRFLSVDPILGDPSAPQTWNRYTYAANNPINLTDPTGMCEQKAGEPPCSDMEITVSAQDVSPQVHYLWLQDETKELDEPFRGDWFSAHLFPNALWMSYQEKQQEKLVGHPVTPGAGVMMMMMMMVGGPGQSFGSGSGARGGQATSGRSILAQNGYITAEGTALRFSEPYYAKLQTRYGSPFLAAQEILSTSVKIGPDPRGKPGFFLYRNGLNEVVYNPSTGEVWHMQPRR